MSQILSNNYFRREVLGFDRKARTDSKAKEDHPTNIQHASDRVKSIFNLCIALEKLSKSSDVKVSYGKTTAQGLRESLGFAGCHRNPFACIVTNVPSIWKREIEENKEISPQKRMRMKQMGVDAADLKSIATDPSPRNIRRISRVALSDISTISKREFALQINATDGLPTCSNRVDSRLERVVRTEANCRLFERVIKGDLKPLDAFSNLKSQMIRHFKLAINHLNTQKGKLQELKLLLNPKVFNDLKKVKKISNIFKYFKLAHKPGIGAKRFTNPLSRNRKTAPTKNPKKMVVFSQEAKSHLKEIKQRIKINTQQLEGTKKFKVDKKILSTPNRRNAQSHFLRLRESVEKSQTGCKPLKRKCAITKTLFL
jgi:hypothetical protein